MVDEGLALCVYVCVALKRNNVLAQMVYNAKKETEFSVISMLECFAWWQTELPPPR